jgi:hypothetical protein
MTMSPKALFRILAGVLLLWTAGAGLAHAQAGGSDITRLLITTYKLKPEMIPAWEALQKAEVVPALKKAGVKTRKVMHTIVGDATEFEVIEPISGFEIFDQPDTLVKALGKRKAADLEARLAQCVESVHRRIENRVNEFFIDPGKAKVQFASKYRPLPGKSFAYTTFYRKYMQPVLLKAKANGTFAGMDYTVSQHGGDWGLITLNMYYDSFAPLDGEPPVAKTLGPEGTRELLAKGQGLIDPIEWIVRERVDDLSF